MRSEGGAADGASAGPSEAEADTVEPVVAVESVSCVELLYRGVDCAMVVAAARTSAEPVSPSMGLAKTEANGVIDRQNQPAAGTVFSSGDGGRNTSDESPRGSRKAVIPYTWLVCAQIVKIGRGEGEPTQDSMFSAGHEPTQGSAFGKGRRARAHPKQCFRCGARAHPRQRAHPKQCSRCGVRAHPNRLLRSARRECAARRSVRGRYRYLQRA